MMIQFSRYRFIIYVLLMSICSPLIAQQTSQEKYQIIHFTSSHTSFPDTGRAHGHTYDSVLYDIANHYNDSSVLILIPEKMQRSTKLNIVFWFHGWRNNIDTAISYYHLTEQFIAAGRNAILVLAETAKNSPDSYGGKLERPKIFSELVQDVITTLKQKKLISQKSNLNNIVLAGHSGAYRVIANILENGGANVQEVQLFDAMYGEVDKFNAWLQKDNSNRLINWYTNQGGGTDETSIEMMSQLKKEGLPLLFTEETMINPSMLRSNRIIFVHSARAHNDIIFNPDNFRMILESSPFLR
jgi:hypothetical protein